MDKKPLIIIEIPKRAILAEGGNVWVLSENAFKIAYGIS